MEGVTGTEQSSPDMFQLPRLNLPAGSEAHAAHDRESFRCRGGRLELLCDGPLRSGCGVTFHGGCLACSFLAVLRKHG